MPVGGLEYGSSCQRLRRSRGRDLSQAPTGVRDSGQSDQAYAQDRCRGESFRQAESPLGAGSP